MPLTAVTLLVNALLTELPDTNPAVITVKPERPPSNTGRQVNKVAPNKPGYNPGTVYMLELATILTLRDSETIQKLGEPLNRSLQNIIRNSKNIHPLTLSRVITYQLSLLRQCYVSVHYLVTGSVTDCQQECAFMRPPVILHSMSSFDQDILERAAAPIITGLSRMASVTPLWKEITTSPDFWSILQRLHQHQDGSAMIFELLENVVESDSPVIIADNYEAAVNLANDFANAGSIVAMHELQREGSVRKGKPAKKAKTQ